MAEPSGPRVTRDVDPAALRDLLEHPLRATIAFVRDGLPDALPVRTHFDGSHRFAVAGGDAPALNGHEVVLLVDDGSYWFQLRGVSARGIARRAEPPGSASAAQLVWYTIETRRVLAWDYATVRQA